ncbi:MAG: polyphosphate polymerase domain-containing protein [Bacteroidales bacterium]|nr:polyphosphate polymerase domain-containing protein [Bacteroidales bacterium]
MNLKNSVLEKFQNKQEKVLLNRLEYKYLVPVELLDKLRSAIKSFVVFDNYAKDRPDNHYTVKSIYLDTIDLKHYYEKVDGLKIRKKFRIRGYNEQEENSIVFLEVKRRYENYISKNRSSLYYNNLNTILKTRNYSDYILPQEKSDPIKDANYFLFYVYAKSLRPLISVVYEREAYFSKFDPKFRISFDKNLRSLIFPSLNNLYEDNELKKVMPKYFVLETKFTGFYPSWMKNIIKEFNLTRRSVSKYRICLDFNKVWKPNNKIKAFDTSYLFLNDKAV